MDKYCPAQSVLPSHPIRFSTLDLLPWNFYQSDHLSKSFFHCIVPSCFLSPRSRPCLTARSRTGTTSPASGSEQRLSPPPTSAATRTSAGKTRRRWRRPLKVAEQWEEEEEQEEVRTPVFFFFFFFVEMYCHAHVRRFSAYFLQTGKGNAKGGAKGEKTLNEFAVEYAKSNRSTCKGCEQKIEKVCDPSSFLWKKSWHRLVASQPHLHPPQDQIRVSKKSVDPEKPQLGLIDRWYHTACFVSRREELMFKPEFTGAQLKGFNTLRAEDKEELKKRLPVIKTEGWAEAGASDPTRT